MIQKLKIIYHSFIIPAKISAAFYGLYLCKIINNEEAKIFSVLPRQMPLGFHERFRQLGQMLLDGAAYLESSATLLPRTLCFIGLLSILYSLLIDYHSLVTSGYVRTKFDRLINSVSFAVSFSWLWSIRDHILGTSSELILNLKLLKVYSQQSLVEKRNIFKQEYCETLSYLQSKDSTIYRSVQTLLKDRENYFNTLLTDDYLVTKDPTQLKAFAGELAQQHLLTLTKTYQAVPVPVSSIIKTNQGSSWIGRIVEGMSSFAYDHSGKIIVTVLLIGGLYFINDYYNSLDFKSNQLAQAQIATKNSESIVDIGGEVNTLNTKMDQGITFATQMNSELSGNIAQLATLNGQKIGDINGTLIDATNRITQLETDSSQLRDVVNTQTVQLEILKKTVKTILSLISEE